MTDTTASDTALPNGGDGIINGISIASFLQMLEQERHNCRVQVHSDEKHGILYFKEGDLVDAEFEHLRGIEAAYAIVSWENSSIALAEAISRTRRIEHPLGYILLNAAKQQDEQNEEMVKPAITYITSEAKTDQEFKDTITVLSSINGIQYFYLLNKKGKVVAHSAPNPVLGELIIYCIMTSASLKKSLKTKSPRRIHMQMKDGSSLLILPKAGKILGLVLNPLSSASEISSQINSGLAAK